MLTDRITIIPPNFQTVSSRYKIQHYIRIQLLARTNLVDLYVSVIVLWTYINMACIWPDIQTAIVRNCSGVGFISTSINSENSDCRIFRKPVNSANLLERTF